jgi:hypothetical protein
MGIATNHTMDRQSRGARTARKKGSRAHQREAARPTPAKADRTSLQRLAELDGYTASPLLSFRPTPPGQSIPPGVRRWETSKRYYEARIELDMFGTPILLAANGGKGTRLGMLRVIAAGEQIEQALQVIERRREAHGYVRVS